MPLTESDLTYRTVVQAEGCEYRIIAVAIQIDPPTKLVIYRDKPFGATWALPLDAFLGRFELVKRAPTREDMERASEASAEWYEGAIARGEIP